MLAVAGVALVALVDSLRRAAADAVEPSEAVQASERTLELVPGREGGFTVDGSGWRARVLLDGDEYLSGEEIDAGFEDRLTGLPFEIAHVALAPDGTLALAIWKFETRPVRNAIQLWDGKTLVSAFDVPQGTFGGGLAFSRDGEVIAAYSPHRERLALYDRNGTLLPPG